MRNPITLSVVLVSLLSGCSVSAPLSLDTERVVKAPKLREVSAKANSSVRTLPAQRDKLAAPTTGSLERSEAGADASATSEAVATDVTPALAAGPVILALKKAPPADIGLIPILDDEGLVDRMLVRGGLDSLDWAIAATPGSGPVRLAKVRVEFEAKSSYPLLDPADAPASDELPVEPMSADFTPNELSFPEAFAPGGETILALDLHSALFSSFLNLYYGTATLAVTLTLLGEDGQPLRDDRDRPLVLKHTLHIL